MIERFSKFQILLLIFVSFFLVILISIPFRTVMARLQAREPQLILVLGGDNQREVFAASLAQKYPNLPILVSSGSRNPLLLKTFAKASIDLKRLQIDRRARDTVTNFTTIVKDLQKQKIHHIYLITSDYHMLRASTIAVVVLGSRGIAFTPISVPGKQPPESQIRVARDVARAFIWIITGVTGASFKGDLA